MQHQPHSNRLAALSIHYLGLLRQEVRLHILYIHLQLVKGLYNKVYFDKLL